MFDDLKGRRPGLVDFSEYRAGTGASLLDPVPAHLITPKYEHELPSGNGKCGAACLCC